jgi:hypothetical protein
MKTKIVVSILLLAGLDFGQSQGFTNLDFEKATIVAGPGGLGAVASNAIPAWTAFINGTAQTVIGYNIISLGDAAVSIQGPGSGEPILQGQYTVLLQANYPSATIIPAIAQTGTIPSSAQSFMFYTDFYFWQVFFANQQIPLSVLGSTSTYKIYGGDISTFAGQTGQLLIQGNGLLDNIQFSSSPIPEPTAFALATLGGLLLGFRRWRNSSR